AITHNFFQHTDRQQSASRHCSERGLVSVQNQSPSPRQPQPQGSFRFEVFSQPPASVPHGLAGFSFPALAARSRSAINASTNRRNDFSSETFSSSSDSCSVGFIRASLSPRRSSPGKR